MSYNKKRREQTYFEKSFEDKILRYITEYYKTHSEDENSEDILMDALTNDKISVTSEDVLYNFDELADVMDRNFADSNLSLGLMRFKLRLMKRNYFTKRQIEILSMRHFFTRYTLETYTNLHKNSIEKILARIQEVKDQFGEDVD